MPKAFLALRAHFKAIQIKNCREQAWQRTSKMWGSEHYALKCIYVTQKIPKTKRKSCGLVCLISHASKGALSEIKLSDFYLTQKSIAVINSDVKWPDFSFSLFFPYIFHCKCTQIFMECSKTDVVFGVLANQFELQTHQIIPYKLTWTRTCNAFIWILMKKATFQPSLLNSLSNFRQW